MENYPWKDKDAGEGSSFISPDTGDFVSQEHEKVSEGKIDPRFIISIGGREFALYEGLLNAAHEEGLSGISTELIQIPSEANGNVAICKARITTSKGTFEGIGDASSENVNEIIRPHIIRMAETRAKARALRDAVNVGICSVEELGPVETNNNQKKVTNKQIAYIEMLLANEDQKEIMRAFLTEIGKDKIEDLTTVEASKLIDRLKCRSE